MSLKKEVKVGAVQTTGATPTNITGCAVAVPDNKEGTVVCHIIARSGGDTKGFELWGVIERPSGGSLGIIGSIQSLATAQGDAGLSAAVATLASDGSNNLVPQVTGIALTTIDWDAWMEVYLKS